MSEYIFHWGGNGGFSALKRVTGGQGSYRCGYRLIQEGEGRSRRVQIPIKALRSDFEENEAVAASLSYSIFSSYFFPEVRSLFVLSSCLPSIWSNTFVDSVHCFPSLVQSSRSISKVASGHLPPLSVPPPYTQKSCAESVASSDLVALARASEKAPLNLVKSRKTNLFPTEDVTVAPLSSQAPTRRIRWFRSTSITSHFPIFLLPRDNHFSRQLRLQVRENDGSSHAMEKSTTLLSCELFPIAEVGTFNPARTARSSCLFSTITEIANSFKIKKRA